MAILHGPVSDHRCAIGVQNSTDSAYSFVNMRYRWRVIGGYLFFARFDRLKRVVLFGVPLRSVSPLAPLPKDFQFPCNDEKYIDPLP